MDSIRKYINIVEAILKTRHEDELVEDDEVAPDSSASPSTSSSASPSTSSSAPSSDGDMSINIGSLAGPGGGDDPNASVSVSHDAGMNFIDQI
jgi:hypothetical protein